MYFSLQVYSKIQTRRRIEKRTEWPQEDCQLRLAHPSAGLLSHRHVDQRLNLLRKEETSMIETVGESIETNG